MGFWNWFKKFFGFGAKDSSADTKPLISLVLLLREQRFLDDHVLADIVHKAWGVQLGNDDPDATDFVVGTSPSFMVKWQERLFLVNNFPMPYVSDVDTSASAIPESRLRKAFLAHKAWLSVDLLGEESPEKLPETYRQIGKLIAALADTDCTALYSPATKQMVPYDDSFEEKLCRPNVLEVFKKFVHVPVVEVPDDDPRMKAAVAQARRCWPEFVAAFERRRPGQRFAVKAPITDGANTEFIWADVTGIEGDQILGTLENEPVDLKGLHYGSRVRILTAELNDWIVSDGKSIQSGGFTIKVLQDLHGDWIGPPKS